MENVPMSHRCFSLFFSSPFLEDCDVDMQALSQGGSEAT
jgi:hypothetical protein